MKFEDVVLRRPQEEDEDVIDIDKADLDLDDPEDLDDDDDLDDELLDEEDDDDDDDDVD